MNRIWTILTMVLLMLLPNAELSAKDKRDHRPNLCEVGVQGGCGYYVGDATGHIFQNVRETYGGQFRYKFTPRWALAAYGYEQTILIPTESGKERQILGNVDVTAEFNFFRIGERQYDKRYMPLSPYMFLGVGCSMFRYEEAWTAAAYLPVGFGLKWKFSDHVGLNLRWQHNIFFSDKIEGKEDLNNKHELNGSNIFNNDITSQLTLGIVFEFARERKVCKFCKQ